MFEETTVVGLALIGAAIGVTILAWPQARSCRDVFLFLTHTPHSFPVDRVVDGYRITRVERVGGTALITGGMAPCWQVFGMKEEPDVQL